MSAACCRAHWHLAWQRKAKALPWPLHKAGQSSVEVDDCSAEWLHLLMTLTTTDWVGASLHVHMQRNLHSFNHCIFI